MDEIDKNILDCCKLVCELYETVDGGVGGYGHIVFDDGNLDNESILLCIENAENNIFKLSEETRIKSIEALKAILKLSYIERFFVYHEYSNYEDYANT
jgi:hypothetical protein